MYPRQPSGVKLSKAGFVYEEANWRNTDGTDCGISTI